jgi:predicted MFS family arabinose efflux permease
MSWVSAAFPVASVLGVPAGLMLAGRYGWHAPFFLLASCAALNVALATAVLPAIKTAVQDHQPLRQMREIVAHAIHRKAFALGAVLVMAGGLVIPFLAPTFIANVGLDEARQLPLSYMVGGIATAFSTPLIGALSDRTDRFRLLAIMSLGAIVVVLLVTRLGPSPLWLAALMMAGFMVTMSGRFAPAMAMIANAVEARYRGGFMSVNAALQQAASGLATVAAGWFVVREGNGHLSGFPTLGYVAGGFFLLTVLLAAQLRRAAPHVSRSAKAARAVTTDALASEAVS